jgi:hypothetical protein
VTWQRLQQFLAALLVAATTTTVGWAQSEPPSPLKVSLDRLSWVTGAWTGTLGDRIIEQHWSAPLAGSIVAMYRSIQKDKTTLYELLAMEQLGDGVVLRIKHFAPGPGLVSREARDQSIDHTLVSLEGEKAVFIGGDAASPIRITFTRKGTDALDIVVERRRDGAPVSTTFNYKRIARSTP